MLTPDVAAFMLTNPSTLGLFEDQIVEIADAVHANGSLLYYDGANLNALMGIVRPGDMGFDVVHVNVHKTFSTPHGGGGPGAGPVAVKKPRSRPTCRTRWQCAGTAWRSSMTDRPLVRRSR
jgi:glycine dehydrogenase subunit 2